MADTLGTEGAIQPGDAAIDETAPGGVEVTVDASELAEGGELAAGETIYTYDAPDEASESARPAPRPVIDGTIRGTGRRKEAVVRVRLTAGTGQWKLNGRPLEEYFPNKVHQQAVNEPFRVLEREGAYDVIALLSGGGISGQAGALRLGIARALIAIDENDRPALKRAGFLTRDARVKERKKYGLKKARKAPQYSKR